MFHVGQKVVCVCDDWNSAAIARGIIVPVAGREYVIRSIETTSGDFGIRLHWLINEPMQFNDAFGEPAFAMRSPQGRVNFRPVIERKTDISIFTEMLPPSEPRRVRKPERAA